MAFTAKDVMTLRDKSGAGMLDCKKALTDADGDMEKAAELLRERGIAKAVKKEGRIAAEGVVGAYVCEACGTGVLLEINCESDFVSRGDKFHGIVDRPQVKSKPIFIWAARSALWLKQPVLKPARKKLCTT